MINLFKKAVAPLREEPATNQVIEQIHTEFRTAGDFLLKEALEVINRDSPTNTEKANRLHALGFTAVSEVKAVHETQKEKTAKQNVHDAICEASLQFPGYKFITEEVVKRICEKYNLVFGEQGQYKGFVPEKNLVEIEQFVNTFPEAMDCYYRRINGAISSGRLYCSKQDYEDQESPERLGRELNIPHSYLHTPGAYDFKIHKGKVSLKICAPIKDMDMTGYQREGYKLVKHIPDPVVLLPKFIGGVKLYVILTAWGDESKDPEIINETQN